MSGRGGERERPAVGRDTEFFWAGIDVGELRIQRCAACSVLRHPPRPTCASCRSRSWDWVLSAGRGELYSYAVVHHPPVPGRSMPHAVALVELDEGVRILAEMPETDPAGLGIGARVQVVFPVDAAGVFLAVRPAQGGPPGLVMQPVMSAP